ncbi:sucrose transport protein SUT1-like [Asparagus officinalis]|uniref:sucrose transport protein SUT1-like n=1 Tax=Asparagus officinalis TaxID=4686 RepID=UPI00098E4488|nr:sucrose transport protein SUT1-like [Asparagus officinalis]
MSGPCTILIEPLCRKLTPRIVWVTSNFMVCLAMIALSNRMAKSKRLHYFSLHLSVLYSVPFAVTATLAASRGGDQGLCAWILNISIVVPQVIVVLGVGNLTPKSLMQR